MRSSRLMLVAWLVAPLMLFGGSVGASIAYVCGMDGIARKTCCCAPSETPADAAPRFERASCCDIQLSQAVDQAPARIAHEDAPVVEVVLFVAELFVPTPDLPETHDHAMPAAGPPPPGIPLLLQKTTLLL